MSTNSMSRRAALAGIAAVAAASGCNDEEIPAPRVPATPQIHAMERRMFELVNRDRAANGKPPLTYDEKLADIARAHAADMRDANYFAHDSPRYGTLDDRIARAGVSFATARENLAEAPTVEEAEQNLLKSPGHFANLVADDVSHVGVGIVKGGVEHPNMFVFVQVFARPVVQESPEKAKETVLAKITKARASKGRPAPVVDDALDELAMKYVERVDDAMGRSSLDKAGADVLEELKAKRAANLAVVVSGQRVVAASEYEPSPMLVDKNPLRLGIGTAAAKDERGRPAIKVLVLAGA